MKPITFCFTAFFLLITSCKNGTSVKEKTPSNKILQQQKIFDTTKWEANTIDTFNYSNLPYWNEKMDRFDTAYVDTFSVDGCKFRFVNPLTNVGKEYLDASVYLEKEIKNKWIFNGFYLGQGNHIRGFQHSRDINHDGFVDITQNQKWKQQVYFFNPKNKNFDVDTTRDNENYINAEWELLDTARNIFCDFNDFKQMCNDIHSTLYTYNGFVKQDLYDLELYNCTKTDNDTHLVTKLIISKIFPRKYYDPTIFFSKDSLIAIQEIKLSHPIDLDKNYDSPGYFDYVKFWKERYKKLLSYE